MQRSDRSHDLTIRLPYALMMGSIDWRLAQRIGEMVAGTPTNAGGGVPCLPAVGEVAARISAYSRLDVTMEPPPLELVDRPKWIAANLRTMRPVLEPLTDRMGSGLGPLAGAARSASGLLMGIQVGALTGMLSQRVLGQYDLVLLDASIQPRLLLVAPNLSLAARNLRVDEGELVSWVTIHEVTHAVQFGGAPWLRDHLGGILSELIESMQVSVSSSSDPSKGFSLKDLSEMKDFASMRSDLNELVRKAREGELLRMTLGEDRWQLVDRMQATMSLIEGHAEHVMDVVGAEVLPSLPRMRAAMNRRRRTRPLPWRVLEKLLGLELKMRQYELGRSFCDAVVSKAGPEGLAQAFASAEHLPSTAELEAPELWLSRTA